MKWGAAIVAVCVLVGAGCGQRTTRERRTLESARTPADTMDALALEVERQYLAAAGDSASDGTPGAPVASAVRSLLDEILARERPIQGWQPDVLEEAIQRHGLYSEVRELEPQKTPWLVLASGPKRNGASDFAWLVNPRTGGMRPIDAEPFRNPYQFAVWPDSAGRRFLVTGLRRSPAGPQPAAWLFRIPEKDSSAVLTAEGNWGLSGVGSAEVQIVRASEKAVPRISVTRAVLPNPLFDECPSCPHLEGNLIYRIAGTALVVDQRKLKSSPYSAFVHLIESLTTGDENGAFGAASNADVVMQARYLGFDHRPTRGRWRIAPGYAASSLDQIYLRGEDGAYRVLSAPGDTGYVITSISATNFTID